MTVAYDGTSAELERILELHSAGEEIVCGHCGAALLIALTHEEAGRLNIHPGVFCAVNQKHVAVFRTLRAPERDRNEPKDSNVKASDDEEWFKKYRKLKGWDKDPSSG